MRAANMCGFNLSSHLFRKAGLIRVFALFVVLGVWSTTAVCSPASILSSNEEGADFTPLSSSLEDDITYLLFLVQSRTSTFDRGRINDMLEFIADGKGTDLQIQPAERDNIEGTYFQTDLRSSLSRITALCYNPDIPSHVAHPSSVRLSGWLPDSGLKEGLEKLQTDPLTKDGYVMVRGIEYQEITPDTTTGGYYRYELDRVLLRFMYEGRGVIVSIGKQRRPSSPGKKGLIIGDDREWNYFYSGIKGLTLGGLGWAKTYVYDSFHITVYYEIEPDKPITRTAMFSWLKGGWCAINVVSTDHIYKGAKRSVSSFKEVIESPALSDTRRLAETAESIRSLSTDELKNRLRPYANALKEIGESHPVLSRRTFLKMIENGDYLNHLSREELESLLFLEYLKHEMGKTSRASLKPSAKNRE